VQRLIIRAAFLLYGVNQLIHACFKLHDTYRYYKRRKANKEFNQDSDPIEDHKSYSYSDFSDPDDFRVYVNSSSYYRPFKKHDTGDTEWERHVLPPRKRKKRW
jgi:hypothetical protein